VNNLQLLQPQIRSVKLATCGPNAWRVATHQALFCSPNHACFVLALDLLEFVIMSQQSSDFCYDIT